MGYRWFRNSRVLLLSPLLITVDIGHQLWRTAGGNGPSSRPSGHYGARSRGGGGHHGSRSHFPEPCFQCGGYGRTRPCGYYRNAADRCRDG